MPTPPGARIIHAMRTAALGLALYGATGLAAQGTTPPPGAQAPKRLFVDSVVASVNDSAILQSRLFATCLLYTSPSPRD